MYSLVVLLSMVALAATSPSGLLAAAPLAYSALPAAVSHQSRLDIKSEPAVVSTYAAAPVAYSAALPAVAAPVAYSAPVAVAPAAVSHQSRVDIKSSPAVVSTSYAAPVAYGAAIPAAPIAYSAPLFNAAAIATPAISAAPVAYGAPLIKTAAIATPAFAAPGIAAAFAAPGIAAAIPAPVVPLDTPEVAAARAAHFEAKALAGAHLIKKRSAPLLAAPLVSTYAAPLAYSAPLPIASYAAYSALPYSTPLITKTYGVHAW